MPHKHGKPQDVFPLELFTVIERPTGSIYERDVFYNDPGYHIIHSRHDNGDRVTLIVISTYNEAHLLWWVEKQKFLATEPILCPS